VEVDLCNRFFKPHIPQITQRNIATKRHKKDKKTAKKEFTAEVFSCIMYIVLLINQKDYELIFSLMGKAEVLSG